MATGAQYARLIHMALERLTWVATNHPTAEVFDIDSNASGSATSKWGWLVEMVDMDMAREFAEVLEGEIRKRYTRE